MSTFSGRLKDCDLLSVDRFDGANLSSKIFFLSHFHGDHMVGLNSPEFAERLRSGCRLYTHHITKALIQKDTRFAHWEPDWVVGRDTFHSFLVRIPAEPNADIFVETVPSMMDTVYERERKESDYIRVSFMPSRHCLGSVMMLFEFSDDSRKEKIVLYTGDFRLTADDLNTRPFHALRTNTSSSQVKRIDAVYYDSTFCDKRTEMVGREESRKEVVRLAKEWIQKDRHNKVLIWSYAHYGHEFLLTSLHRELGIKCHVTNDKLDVYECLGQEAAGLKEAVTGDSTSQLHACSYYKELDTGEDEFSTEPSTKRRKGDAPVTCPDCNPIDSNVLVIKVSMMAFAMTNSREISRQSSTRDGISYWNVQYSCHSSLDEVISLFKYTRPLLAYPNVVAPGRREQDYLKYIRPYLRRRRPVILEDEGRESSWELEIAERSSLIERLRQLELEQQ